MSSKVRSCELEPIELSEECYSEMCTFLDTFHITAIEAQIILEVASYRQHHMDLNMLSKKIPKEFKSFDVEESVKKLIGDHFLESYIKKDVLCVRCAAWGWDVANFIRDKCYSEKLRYFDNLRAQYDERKYHLCSDPQGFKEGDIRHARGSKDEKIPVIIMKKTRGDRIFRYADNGAPLYEIKLVAEVACPKCRGKIVVEVCYNPANCYKEFNTIDCAHCGFEFKLRYALDIFYSQK